MHLTRQQVPNRISIRRKGTKYVARALSHLNSSVPVVIALRDILKIAKTKKEVEKLVQQKLIKINNRVVQDIREPVIIFNILESGKSYKLTLNKSGKYIFEETKDKKRLCKVIGKRLVQSGKIQLSLHDGSNILGDKKINVSDSIYLDFSNKLVGHSPMDKNVEVMIISGKYSGSFGKIESISDTVKIKLADKSIELNKENIIAI